MPAMQYNYGRTVLHANAVQGGHVVPSFGVPFHLMRQNITQALAYSLLLSDWYYWR